MTQAWVALTGPDGSEITMPSEQQLVEVLAQLYGGGFDLDGEAAVAVLRFGYDDGLMYEVEVSSAGAVRFEEWSDRDCEIALASPRHMCASQSDALQLWRWMAQRQVAKIRGQPWQT